MKDDHIIVHVDKIVNLTKIIEFSCFNFTIITTSLKKFLIEAKFFGFYFLKVLK